MRFVPLRAGKIRRARALGFTLGLLGLAPACTPRPSASACEAMAAHVVELARMAHEGRAAEIAGDVANDHSQVLRERCIEEGTSREVACVLGAESLESVQECAPTR